MPDRSKSRLPACPSELLALAVVALTSLQAAFLTPYVVVVPGQRANVFTALLCACGLVCAILFHDRSRARARPGEVVVSFSLGALALASGLASIAPLSSSLRAFTVAASALGGFWCARLLLAQPGRRETLVVGASSVLGLLLVTSLAGYFLTGHYHHFTDSNQHPLLTRLIMLSFAPLTLIHSDSRRRRVSGVALLAATFVVLCLSELRSAVLLPLVLGGLALLLGKAGLRLVLALLVCTAAAAAVFLHLFPHKWFRLSPDYEPAYYRVENYPFSWHVALRNPWLGNGPRAPRTRYLDGYTIRYPGLKPERFRDSVDRLRISENVFLTFMADLGFPFAILYTVSLVALFLRLFRAVRAPPASAEIPPMALFLPLSGALIHFLIFDGPYHPEVGWFFHLLLGLIEPDDPAGLEGQ